MVEKGWTIKRNSAEVGSIILKRNSAKLNGIRERLAQLNGIRQRSTSSSSFVGTFIHGAGGGLQTRVEYQPGPGDNRRSGSVRMVVVSTVGNLRSVDPYVSSELDNFEFKPVSGAWASPPEPQQGPCKDRRRAALSCDLRRAQTALAVVVCHPPHSPAPTALHGTCPFQCRIRDSRRPPARRARSGPCAAAACAW